MFHLARENNPQIYALIFMLHDGALRIQDAVGLKFEQITKLKPDNNDFKILSLLAKKTTARKVAVSENVIKAVKEY